MQQVLKDLRKINTVLQYDNLWTLDEKADLPFNTLSGVLGTLLKVDLFIASPEGRILGVHDQFKLNNARMYEYVSTRQFPDFYMNALNSIETNLENISVDAELTIFPVELKQEYLEAKTTIIPIYASGNRLGFVVMGKAKESFSAGDLILAEHAATVIGTELLHWQTKRIEQENREKQNVHLALKSLSYSEIEAIKIILSLFDGIELRFTALKIAKEFDITRTVIVNAIRKLESAGVLESRSLGTKGTFLRIKNQHIHQALNAELANL